MDHAVCFEIIAELLSSLRRRVEERCFVAVVLDCRVCLGDDEDVDYLQEIPHRRNVQGSVPLDVARVDDVPLVQRDGIYHAPHNVRVPALARKMEEGGVCAVVADERWDLCNQSIHGLHSSCHNGQLQGSLPVFIRVLSLCLVLNQQIDKSLVSVLSSKMQRSASIVGCCVRISPVFDQELCCIQLPVLRCHMKSSEPVVRRKELSVRC